MAMSATHTFSMVKSGASTSGSMALGITAAMDFGAFIQPHHHRFCLQKSFRVTTPFWPSRRKMMARLGKGAGALPIHATVSLGKKGVATGDKL